MRSRRGWSLPPNAAQGRRTSRRTARDGTRRSERTTEPARCLLMAASRSPDVSSRRSPAAEAPPLPDQAGPPGSGGRYAGRARTLGGSQGWFNVGKRLRGAVRASESAARALALRLSVATLGLAQLVSVERASQRAVPENPPGAARADPEGALEVLVAAEHGSPMSLQVAEGLAELVIERFQRLSPSRLQALAVGDVQQ